MAETSPEQPAKNYQLTVLEQRIEQNEKLNERVDAKLDSILQNMVTSKQYDERMISMNRDFDSKLSAAIREVHLEYGPLKKNYTWLWRTLLVTGLGVIVQLIILYVSFLGRAK